MYSIFKIKIKLYSIEDDKIRIYIENNVILLLCLFQNQQLELDLLLERSSEILQQADSRNKVNIQEQTGEVSEQWSSLVSGLESRKQTLSKLAHLWEDFESKWQAFEGKIVAFDERTKHVDLIVRSRQHVIDTKTILQVN